MFHCMVQTIRIRLCCQHTTAGNKYAISISLTVSQMFELSIPMPQSETAGLRFWSCGRDAVVAPASPSLSFSLLTSYTGRKYQPKVCPVQSSPILDVALPSVTSNDRDRHQPHRTPPLEHFIAFLRRSKCTLAQERINLPSTYISLLLSKSRRSVAPRLSRYMTAHMAIRSMKRIGEDDWGRHLDDKRRKKI
jgi:hypothetical protein